MSRDPSVVVGTGAEAAADAAATLLADLIRERREAAANVHISLAGGSTPRRAYEILSERVEAWHGVHLWFGDERVVPPDDQDSNERMVREALTDRVALPEGQLHRVPTELGGPGACRRYEQEIAAAVPAGAQGAPQLDVALLGLGEDAHTASLFPKGAGLVADGRWCVVVEDSPKPPPTRISMTMELFRAARHVIVLTAGATKAGAVAAMLAGPDERAPVSLLPMDRTTLVTDRAAAARTRYA